MLAGSDAPPGSDPEGPTGQGSPGDPHATPTPAPPSTPLLQRAPAGEPGTYPTELLYQEADGEGARLHRFDLRTGDDEVLVEVPASQILLPPQGDYLAYLTEDGAPALHIRHLETGEEEVFDGLAAPEWSWDGERLFVVRLGNPPPALATISVDEMEVRPLELPQAIEWSAIGWADDELLLFRRPGEGLFLASDDGTLVPIPTPEGEVRDPAPSGEYTFANSLEATTALFQPVDGSPPTIVDLGEWIIGVLGPWAGDDRVFAPVATAFEVDAPSAVLVLDPAGASWQVPNTQGAVRAFPTPEGEGFVLLRGKRGAHRAWACLPNGECRAAPGTIPLNATLLRAG